MAKGNIVRWITVKGRRIPIYEDGTMGGFMEGKKAASKKNKSNSLYDSLKDNKEALEEYGNGDPEVLKTTLQNMAEDARQRVAEEYGVDIEQETSDENDAYDKIKSNIGVSHESNSHDNEVLRIRDELDSGKSTTTSNKEIADMYKNSPKKAFDVKDNGDGTYEISKKGSRNERNMPARSQEQLGRYDKYKQGFYYDRAKEVNVNGHTYKVWSDQNYKGTFAEDKDGNVLPISGSGYLSNELSQRKAIANKFGEESFRSKSIKVGDKEVAVNKTATGSKYKDTSVSDLKQLAFDADLSSNEQYAARRELKNRGYVYEDGRWKKLKIKPGISQNSVY